MASEWPSQWRLQEPQQRGAFSRDDLVWTSTVKKRVFQPGSPCPMPVSTRYALIPWARVLHFVAGEEDRKGFPTSFARINTKKNTGSRLYKSADFTYSEYVKYWCSYGKEDFRSPRLACEGQQSQGKRRSKICSGESIKHGCVCHFEVKRLSSWPDVAAIFYEHTEHVDAAGLVCHGATYGGDPLSKLAPHLSNDVRIWVKKLLLSGMSRTDVHAEHLQNVKRKSLQSGYIVVRDDLLQMRDIENIDKASISIPASRPDPETPSPEMEASFSTDDTPFLRPSENRVPGNTYQVESMETMEYFVSLLDAILRLVEADPKLLEYACPLSREMLNRLKEIQSKQVQGITWDLTLLSKLGKDSSDRSGRKRPFVSP